MLDSSPLDGSSTLHLHGLLRVLNGRGLPIGAAFMVADQLTCTCAHVVARALGLESTPRNAPIDTIMLDRPDLHGRMLEARIHAWDSINDLALLRFSETPPKLRPAPLLKPRPLAGRPLAACGFPTGHAGGVWAYGRFGNQTPAGLIQLIPDQPNTPWVEPGFSGGPAWDVRGHGVAAIITANSPAAAWATPMNALLNLAPELHQHARSPADLFNTHRISNLITAKGFRSVLDLALPTPSSTLTAPFDYIGVRWNATFGFTIGVLRGDTLSSEDIQQYCNHFALLTNTIYNHSHILDIGFLQRTLLFTMAGLLLVVFEQGSSSTARAVVASAQRPGPTYSEGVVSASSAKQATTLFWSVDLAQRQIYRHTGKQSSGWNFHIQWTNEALDEIDTLISQKLRSDE
ncbi:MAG: hypothetical protein Fur005_30020 [Roseiflexaceae bacterium]